MPGADVRNQIRRLRFEHGEMTQQALAGLRERYGGVPHAARRRLDEELAMIERLGFTDYFLLVAEIVGFARARRIPTVGRGSGASSIVAYALGITNVDPIVITSYSIHYTKLYDSASPDVALRRGDDGHRAPPW